jgi:hypothetical protein
VTRLRRRTRPARSKPVELFRNESCRDDENREINRSRQVGHGTEGRETLDLGFTAADRIDRPGERMAFHDLEDAPAQTIRIGRGTDHGHRAWPQQFSDIWHGLVSRERSRRGGQRKPRPRAMMPRRTSVVPPWMVSLGAIVISGSRNAANSRTRPGSASVLAHDRSHSVHAGAAVWWLEVARLASMPWSPSAQGRAAANRKSALQGEPFALLQQFVPASVTAQE